MSGRDVSVFVSDSAILGDLEIGGVGNSWTGDEGRVDAGVANCDGTSRIVELLRDQFGAGRYRHFEWQYIVFGLTGFGWRMESKVLTLSRDSC
jgi:hypothetical protein